ncbi:MAG: phosphoribosylamine--glycine ligase [Chloroflexi bacterium]|nr:phosphoribosylamine--glycine ligase [Chloroflexota bacterium]|tara:strand:- start:5888 stop:7189 length:1302 start_codon:yes stop_codon:yes gene_type:complete
MGITVLVVGSGGREHVICWRILRDRPDAKIYCAPGNGGIGTIATRVPIDATAIEDLVQWAKTQRPDLVIVGPEEPSALGLVDQLLSEDIKTFGPSAAAAQLEASKAWTSSLLEREGIPIPKTAIFDDAANAHGYIDSRDNLVVVKADGLALGKGVLVCSNVEEAHSAVDLLLVKRKFGDAGSPIVIQDRCFGPELSVFALCAGTDFRLLGSARDYKRAYDGNKGPNTGGMGAYTPVTDARPQLIQEIADRVIGPTLEATARAGAPFTGILYAGIMLTPNGPVVIEFNVRLGDPEAQVILTTSSGDFVSAIESAIDGNLEKVDVAPNGSAAVCVVLASNGYPNDYVKGHEIIGLDDLPNGALAFHAGTETISGSVYTAGGRVLSVVGHSDNIDSAKRLAYQAARQITFKGVHMRTDIATSELSTLTDTNGERLK